MVANLFRFMSLFLLVEQLKVNVTDVLLLKREQVNLVTHEVTINHVTYSLSEELVTGLQNLFSVTSNREPFVFVSLGYKEK